VHIVPEAPRSSKVEYDALHVSPITTNFVVR
jgi:hypothetical protein